MERIIKGDELMLFNNEKSIAYATSHTLTINGNTIDISSKDHGFWGASEMGNITWEITSENLFTESYYEQLFDAMINKTPLTVAFGFASDWNVNGLGENQADYSLSKSKSFYTGQAYLTSLTANANTGENATFSITLTGSGALAKVSKSLPITPSFDNGDGSSANKG